MNYEEIFSRHIQAFVKNSGGTQAYGRCCFHDDKVKSFSVNLLTSQWYCHGCGLHGNHITFQQRIGLTPPPGPISSRDYPPRGAGSHEKTNQGANTLIPGTHEDRADPAFSTRKITATYTYQYEDGSSAFRVIRYEPKSFMQQRWENGKWISGTSGIRRVPYRLPQILESKRVIFFVEGEKDVESLERIDCVATTTPMGANSWQKEYAKFFKDKKVVVIPDNDEPGQVFAERVASDISEYASGVRIVRLPGVPEKGDVTDYLQIEGNSRDSLFQLVQDAPELAKKKVEYVDPLLYLTNQGFHVPDGRGAFYSEFPTLCKEVYDEVTTRIGHINDAMVETIDKLEEGWSNCFSITSYRRFLGLIKELHEKSL